MKFNTMRITLIGIMFMAQNATAEQTHVEISGFLTTAMTYGPTVKNTTYLNGLAYDGIGLETRDNRLGIQLSAAINDKMDLTAQLVARGGITNHDVSADWAYVKFKALKNLDIHIGKYKISQFLVSDYADVGYAYPWVRPPQDVYSTNPLISLSGIDLFYTLYIGKLTLLTQVYYGNGNHTHIVPSRYIDEAPMEMLPPGGIAKNTPFDFKTENTLGFSISLQSKIVTVRIGHFTTDVTVPAFNLKKVFGSFSGIGLTFDWQNAVIMAEWITRDTADELAAGFPDQYAWYTTLGFRFGKLLPHFTISQMDEGIDPSPFSLKQTSMALGFRYELAAASAVKLEAIHVNPKEGNHGLFDDPISKGTIYTLSYDVIF